MKRIVEFKVYDILQDKDNEKFLDKVKKENPDLYTRFLNVVGNKGLDVAKEKYKEFDPVLIKLQQQKEKDEKTLRKKIGNKERNKQLSDILNAKYLEKYKTEIEEIQNVLLKSPLKNLEKHIKNNEILGDFFEELTKRYKTDFNEFLKNPKELKRLEYNNDIIIIDSLSYSYVDYESYMWEERKVYKKYMNINQYYDVSTKKINYNIYFDFPYEIEYNNIKIDRNKDKKFIQTRNYHITEKLGKLDIDKKELYDIIFGKLATILSDDFYEKWKLDKSSNKYNI